MILMNMTIGKKLAAALSVFALLILGVVFISYTQLAKQHAETQGIVNTLIPDIQNASTLSADMGSFRRYQLGLFMVHDNPTATAEYRNILQQLEQKIGTFLSSTSATPTASTYKQIYSDWQRYFAQHQELIAMLDRNEVEPARQFLNQARMAYQTLNGAILELINVNKTLAKESEQHSQSIFEQTQVALLAAFILSIILVIALAILLTKQIRNPILLLVEHTKRIAQGDLTNTQLRAQFQTGQASKNEIVVLMQTIGLMQENLHQLVNEIASSAAQLGGAVGQVSAVAKHASHGMQQQQAEVTQLATAMNEMHSTVQEVSRNTTDAAHAAQQASTASETGSQVVNDAIVSIERVASKIEQSGQVVQQLEQDSASISVVLDVIRNIADQTNLLALNAAIEAARAGEQGRGFAVVADEVRTLAQRTQDSTAQINKIIEVLQSRAAEAGQAMQISRQQMQTSVEQARNAGATIEQINHAVIRISDMNTQIASATEQQNSVTDDLNRSIVTIHSASDEVAQGASQTAQACTELNQLVLHLQKVTNRFTV